VIAGSIAANGGRSCINASGVWTPRNAEAIADALAQRFAKVAPLPVDDPDATIAAFASAATAQSISEAIDHDLKTDGAIDVTQQRRGSPRLVHRGRVAYLLPTIIRCDDRDHALANREFLFPFASVVTCETGQMAEAIGPSLVVSAITSDESLIRSLMSSANIDRLNIGAIPTYQLSWDQPHEGNLFEHLYRRRALQIEPAA
ncbi:MAG: aldehyde dehydrogenase family protein, partial [Planctomycetes bacterium]|nr:aldehyde dehydrogenase family protein [Planctomycetota bacterium]